MTRWTAHSADGRVIHTNNRCDIEDLPDGSIVYEHQDFGYRFTETEPVKKQVTLEEAVERIKNLEALVVRLCEERGLA